MKLLIKQRFFTWTDTYDVYDEVGKPKYYVTTEAFTFGHQIHVYDKVTGRELGSVHQKVWTFLPTFEIVIDGVRRGTIQKEWAFFSHRYSVDFRGWDVKGNMFGWDYNVQVGDLTVMTVGKEPFAWGDTYALNFCNPADEMPGLLLVLAIDAANCGNEGRTLMEKITSFTIDHIKLQPGVYVSRKDRVGAETVTTFDLRLTSPNEEPVMNTAEVHTIEHLAATYLRNEPQWKDSVLYFGPMGCRTGFYLLLAGDRSSEEILPLMRGCFRFIAEFRGEVPGASAKDCGNYLDMNLPMANYWGRRYADLLENIPADRLVYPE